MSLFKNASIAMLLFIGPMISNAQYRLTIQSPLANPEPKWSPDGEQIVFKYKVQGIDQIFIMNKDGSHLAQVLKTPEEQSDPSFSPDGNKILFLMKDQGRTQVCVMNKDGSEARNLTNSSFNEYSPRWSPTGDKIVFHSTRDNTAQIYIMNADGSDPLRLTRPEYNHSFPVWSPDGKKIVCNSIIAPKYLNSIIYLDGDSSVLFKPDEDLQYRLDCFSPDSKKILYHSIDHYSHEKFSDLFIYDMETQTSKKFKSNVEGLNVPRFINEDTIMYYEARDLMVMSITTGKKTRIASDVMSAIISPDKNTIVFVHADKYSDICIIGKDGKGFKNLTNNKN
jgi:Tol biopolymer transport system component